MSRSKCFSLMLGLVTSAAFALASSDTASAERLQVNCTGSGQVLPGVVSCDGAAQFGFQSEGPGQMYVVQLMAPTTHCSRVKYIVWRGDGSPMVDFRTALGQTEFLDPGRSSWVRIGNQLARGLQVVRITAVGQVGGCNTGAMGSWAVDAVSSIEP